MFRSLIRTAVFYKLESTTGTLLGVIAIPAHWDDYIRRLDKVEFAIPGSGYVGTWGDPGACVMSKGDPVMIRHAMLARSTGNYPDALMMFGISPEEFEKLPGCAFMPGAAYLRSIAG